jgi:hypothetical protein
VLPLASVAVDEAPARVVACLGRDRLQRLSGCCIGRGGPGRLLAASRRFASGDRIGSRGGGRMAPRLALVFPCRTAGLGFRRKSLWLLGPGLGPAAVCSQHGGKAGRHRRSGLNNLLSAVAPCEIAMLVRGRSDGLGPSLQDPRLFSEVHGRVGLYLPQ